MSTAALRWISLSFGLCALAGAALAEEAKEQRLLVFDLEPKGIDETLARNTTDALLAAIKSRPGFRVLGRNEINLILEHEGQKALLGCSDDSCLAELGETLKGDLVLSGSLGKVGQAFLLSVRIIDVRRAAVTSRASETAFSPDELLEAAGRVAVELLSPGEPEKTAPAFSLRAGSEEITLAVLDLGASGTDEKAAENLTQVVVHELKNFEGISVISRDEIKSMLLHEQSKMLVGCDDASCLAEIGGALGVQYLVSGSAGRMGDTYLLHLKLIDIREARVANRVAEAFQGQESQFIAATRFAARNLVGHRQSGEGKLQVRPSVSDATIILDGEPVEFEAERTVKAGKYNLRLEADGYHPWIGDVYVDEGRLTRLDVEMTGLPEAWYGKWWLWTTVGVVVAGGLAAGLYFGLSGPGETVLDVTSGVPGGAL